MGFKKFRAFFLRSSFYKVILNVYEAIAGFILRRTNLNKVGRDGKTPLYKAFFEEGDYKRVARLVKNGADINAINKDGDTLLHIAAGRGKLEGMDLLIKNGANVNAINRKGCTPLHILAERRRGWWGSECDVPPGAMRLFIKNGADVNVSDKKGYTPLHILAGRALVKEVKLLIENGADVSTVNKAGDTLLHTIISKDNNVYRRLWVVSELMPQLIANGMDISAINKNGHTSLHHAVFEYRREPQKVTLSIILMFMMALLLKNVDTKKPDVINGEQSLSTLWDACKAEVDALSKVTFSIKSLGLLSLIAVCKEEDENKLSLIFQNKEVNKLATTLTLNEKYPHSAREIREYLYIKREKLLARRHALNTACKSIFNFNENKQLNEDCWREILKNLPQEDLKNVTKVASLFFKNDSSFFKNRSSSLENILSFLRGGSSVVEDDSSVFEDDSPNDNLNVGSVMARDDVQKVFSRSV